ncbi:DUF3014 domain-containing protein [Shewanella loihica]|uniref:DUF3014 domain-containing protein n=1 Tax=Shewanella loihica (strain ATCC BAA-1088 / PV-4) TaxID=323850 RepID=A3QIS6_SHELP|nr:DUF3014 domain-containing protein [Shewanella loihica]ABO25374.1 conserved hypothetical protein [Shewanella loihica PV-4]
MQVSQEDRIAPQTARSGINALSIAVVIILVLLAAGAYYFLGSDEPAPEPELPAPITLPEPEPEQPLPTDAALPEPENLAPEPEAQVEEAPAEAVETLPTLAESDQYVHDKTVEVANGMKIDPLLVEKDIVRHFVVFVDNLAQGELARKVSPLKAPNSKFTVSEVTNKTYLNPDSYHRYDLYANFVDNLDEEQLLSTYNKVKPLLGEAFAELGYPDMNFDDRMVEAIDVMLSAPVIDAPIELDSVSVNYKFVDPQLESLPNAQKLMIRMGPENSKKVKAALRKLKKQLKQS